MDQEVTSNRSQYVIYDAVPLDIRDDTCGYLKGYILGPHLFLDYMIDIYIYIYLFEYFLLCYSLIIQA